MLLSKVSPALWILEGALRCHWSLVQAEQVQLSQPVSSSLSIFMAILRTCCNSSMFFYDGSPRTGCSSPSGISEEQNHFPQPAGHTSVVQPRTQLSSWAASVLCWFTLNVLPTSNMWVLTACLQAIGIQAPKSSQIPFMP